MRGLVITTLQSYIKVGECIRNSGSDYIWSNETLTMIYDDEPRTIALWWKSNSHTGHSMIKLGDNGDTYYQFGLKDISTTQNLVWLRTDDYTLTTNQGEDWGYHVLTYDGTNVSYYFNGSLIDTRAKALITQISEFRLFSNNIPNILKCKVLRKKKITVRVKIVKNFRLF